MKKSIAILSAIAAVSAVALVVSPAKAEDLSLHLSGSALDVAHAPWSDPGQIVTNNKFHLGGAGEGKLLFNITPNLSVGPDVAVLYAPQTKPGGEASVLWNFGGAVRLQGAHGDNSWSPYVDFSGGASKQSDILNSEVSSSAGIDFPLESTHTMWAGPMIGWSHTFQTHTDPTEQTALLDHHDSNVILAGFSITFDMPVKPKTVVETQVVSSERVVEHTVQVQVPVAAVPVSTPAPVPFRLTERVNFEKDSAALSTSATTTLDEVAKEILANPGVQVRVEGSSSAEGDASHNLALSHFRAASVVSYLAAHGVDPNALTAVSVGATGVVNDASNRSVRFITINLVQSGR